ncbi:MAG: hypothetical protein AB7Q16_19440 [Vicinamibacterales bacterium]
MSVTLCPRTPLAGAAAAVLAAVLVHPSGAWAQAKDAFPNGCVDCHTSTSKAGDTRLSTHLKEWMNAVPPALLEKTKAAVADPSKIKGKHPAVPKAAAGTPQSCMTTCHRRGSTMAPPFTTLMHTVHLTGAGNQFVSQFQGQCTHCHKMDPKSGAWRIPSGAEK